MNFFRARFAQRRDARPRRGAADNRVVNHHHAFAGHHLVNQVQLHADAEVADELARLQKRAADVVIADERVAVRDAGLFRKTHRRPVAAVGHGDDEVGGDRGFLRELPAEVDAHLRDIALVDVAVGSGKIDVLKNAERVRLLRVGPRIDGVHAVFVDQHDFAGRDVADKLGVDQIQRARLAGQHIGHPVHAVLGHARLEFAEHERPEAEWIAQADQLVLAHDQQRVRALNPSHHRFE